eukprot:2664640-Amphidinium_carterae.1
MSLMINRGWHPVLRNESFKTVRLCGLWGLCTKRVMKSTGASSYPLSFPITKFEASGCTLTISA